MTNIRFLVFTSFLAVFAAHAFGYGIKGPKNPKPWEKTAVRELKDYLARRLPDGTKATVGGRPIVAFHVGDTDFAAKKGLLSKTMEEECWTIRSFGGDVVLNGGGTRGCLYAVYHFLEDFCGVRWWSEKEEDILDSGNLKLPKLAVTDRPAFFYRDICRSNNPKQSKSSHAVRRRLNRNFNVPIPLSLGGAVTYGPPEQGHTMELLLPFDKYGKEHPEYYCLRRGKRPTNGNRLQPCLTNPNVRRIMLEAVMESIKKGKAEAKEGGFSAPLFHDVSMNDNENFCQCPECTTAIERLGHSGLNLEFVNSIAGEVAKKHPEIRITTFAYRYTREPPKSDIKAAPNVSVRICPLAVNFAKSLLDKDEANTRQRVRLDAWRNHADSIMVWDYAVTFGWDTWGYPFPNEWYFGEKYRYYVSRNVRGIMWEQEGVRNSDLFDLKYYFLSRLAEKPDLDYPSLMKRTFNEFFGPKAGPIVYSARARLRDAAEKSTGMLRWTGAYRMFSFLTDADLEFMNAKYDEAEQATAGDARHLRRVKRARQGNDRLLWRRKNLFVKGELDGKSCWIGEPRTFAYILGTEGRHKPDTTTPSGFCLEIFNIPGHVSPLSVSYYDYTTEKYLFSTKVEIPKSEDYVWYDIGRVKVVKDGAFLMASTKLIQIYTPPELEGKTFDVKLFAKTTEKGCIRLGRCALVSVSDGTK